MKRLLLLLLLAIWVHATAGAAVIIPSGTTPPKQPANPWEAWTTNVPTWLGYTPSALMLQQVSRLKPTAALGLQKLKNVREYDRFCSPTAPYYQQPFCQAIQPKLKVSQTSLIKHSPLWILFNSLINRAGTGNAAALDATRLLIAFRTLLNYPPQTQSHPDYLIGQLYLQFSSCVPPKCQPAVTRPEGINNLFLGLKAYFATYGSQTEIQALEYLRKSGL